MNTSRTPERNYSSTLDEEILRVAFPSGLQVLFCPKRGFKKKYACYSTFYGSVDSEFVEPAGTRLKVPDGIAHFLEHTLFETEAGNVSDLFARRGAYNNAATSFTTTSYLFASTDHFYENLELLLHFVENPVFKPEKVEKEMGIIEQEIRGYEDSPQWVSYMGLLENLFRDHPIRIDIAGKVETIRKIDAASLERCYGAFYHPSNMILFAVGDLEPDQLFAFVEARSRHGASSPTQPGPFRVERLYPEEPRAVHQRESRKEMEVALPKLLMGFKEVDVPVGGESFVLRELASQLALELVFGRSSDLFQELYEARLVLDDFGASYSLGAGIGYAIVGGETPAPEALLEVLLKRLKDLASRGLEAADFERGKRRFMGSFIRSFNALEYIAGHYTYYAFHGFDLFQAVDLLARLDRDLLEERLRCLLDPQNYAAYVVLPKS